MFSRFCSLIFLFSLFLSCNQQNVTASNSELQTSDEIYQNGDDKYASWAYVGFVPRLNDSKRLKITVSKRGFSFRIHAQFTRAEIEKYAEYLMKKATQMRLVQNGDEFMKWNDGTYTTPFEVMEPNIYQDFYDAIDSDVLPVVGAGFDANLELLKKFFPDNVYVIGDVINLHLVYPITTEAASFKNFAWVNAAPKAAKYNIHTNEERRTIYQNGKGGYIFAGFPAMWFNGGIGFHGPIKYTTDEPFISGEHGIVEIDGKDVTKRWQLVRKPDSHGCIRMENHMEVRHLMPAQVFAGNYQSELQKVVIEVTNDYDWYDLDNNGTKELIGVKYYWVNPEELPNEAAWKSVVYQNINLASLKEFEYRLPQVVQLKVLNGVKPTGQSSGINPTATMAKLNRLPL